MLAILLFHTESYYNGHEIIPYDFYVANVLMAFFFVSGYVFNNPQKPFSASYKLRSIVWGIIIPYFFFTTILAVPKAFVTHRPVVGLLTAIVCGNGSWFVTALVVVQLMATAAFMANKRWVYALLPVGSFVLALLLQDTEVSNHHNYWNFHNALAAMPFFFAGCLYRRVEPRLQLICHPLSLILYLPVLVLLKIYEQNHAVSLVVEPVIFGSWPVFLTDMFTGILLLLAVCRLLPRLRYVEWIGSHSLVVYFFCGAVPTAVALVFHKTGFHYNNQYWHVLMAFILVCLLTTAVTWLCYRYLPFLRHKTPAVPENKPGDGSK